MSTSRSRRVSEEASSIGGDLVLVDSKDFAQVVFDDVRDEYAESRDVECEFTLNELLAADPTDSVGVYKVGFCSHRDFVCQVPVDLAHVSQNHGTVCFSADKLPRDDGEFYQFVYVSQSKQIRGASVPFQFKKARLSDYVEIEDQEAIVYKSKESAINDTLIEVKSKCIHLSQANETYERLVKENEELIACLRAEINAVKRRCLDLTIENERVNNSLKAKTDNLAILSSTVTSLNADNARLQNKFESLTAENRDLIESLNSRIEQIAQLKTELESIKTVGIMLSSNDETQSRICARENELVELKRDKEELNSIADELKRINDQIVKLEKQVDERVEELTRIKLELKRNEAIVVEQAMTIQSLLSERDNLQNTIGQLGKEKSELEYNQENLVQELSMSRDKLLAADERKEMMSAQLNSLTDELQRAQSTILQQANEIEQIRTRERETAQKDILIEKLEKEKNAIESDLEQSNGTYFALKLAHSHLEARLKASEAARLKQERDFKATLERQSEEIDELKERIKAGAKEYSKLFDKYRLVRNQQLNMDVNVYHNLNGDLVIGQASSSEAAAGPNVALFERFFNSPMLNESQQFDSDSAIQDKSPSSGATALSTSGSGKDEEERLWTELEASAAAARLKISASASVEQIKPVVAPPFKSSSSSSPSSFQSAATSSSAGSATIVPDNSAKLLENISDESLISLNAKAGKNRSLPFNAADKRELSKDQINGIEKEANSSSSKVLRLELKNRSLHNEPNSNCEICEYIFPSNSTVEEIEKHYLLHYGPTCPVCLLMFHKNYPQEEFERHVQDHFTGSD